MNQCPCGSFAINDDPAKQRCDCCWRDAQLVALQKENTLLLQVIDAYQNVEAARRLGRQPSQKAMNVLFLFQNHRREKAQRERLDGV